MILKIAWILAYIFIGMVMASVVRESWQKPSIVIMLFWPLSLGLLVVFGFMSIAIEIGERIKRMIDR